MGFVGKITGQDVADKINEHSEIYGEVLLGMHRDLKSQHKLIKDYRKEMSTMMNEARSLQADIQKNISRTSLAIKISIVAIVFSLISIGISVWTKI